MANAGTLSEQQREQGMWLFVKVPPSQLYVDGVTQPNQVEIEIRLNAFFAALDAKAKGNILKP